MGDPLARRSLSAAVVVVLVGLAVDVHTASRPLAADRPVPFAVGETLTYDVSWSTYLTAGTVSLTVQNRRDVSGRPAYDLVAEAKPGALVGVLYPVYYKLETLLDASTLQPIQAIAYSKEHGRVREQTTTFVGPTTIAYTVQTSTTVRERRQVPAFSQDPLAAVYVLRALPLATGQTISLPVTDGADTYRLRVQVGAVERVTSGAGTFTGWRVTPTLLDAAGRPETNRHFTLWLSNDARRLPLKLEASLPVGTFVLTLAGVK